LIAAIVIGEIASVVWVKKLGLPAAIAPATQTLDYSNTKALGGLLYTQYLYPLQLAAAILLIAIVAAIVLTMRKRAGQKLQDINAQVAVNARDRVRIVKVTAVKPEAATSSAENQP